MASVMPYFAAWWVGPDQPADPRHHEVLVLVRFEQVECLFVGEARVVDEFDAVPNALLDRLAGAGVRCNPLAVTLGLLRQHRDFLFGERGHLGRNPGDVFARQVDLEVVDAVLDEGPRRAPDLLRAAAHASEAQFLERQVGQRVVAERALG